MRVDLSPSPESRRLIKSNRTVLSENVVVWLPDGARRFMNEDNEKAGSRDPMFDAVRKCEADIGARRGKLAVAAKLHVLDPGRAAFFRALGRIRNRYAHDVRHATLRIEDFANSLPPEERVRFWRDLMRGYTIEPVIVDSGSSMPTEEFVAAHHRFTIWISAMSALSLIYRTKAIASDEREKLVAFLSAMKPLRTR